MFQGLETKFSEQGIGTANSKDLIRCKNQSGEVIPPRSAVQLDGTFTSGARDVIKPNGNSLDSNLIVFSGEQTVPIDGEFWAITTFEALTTTSDTPSIGDDIGTASGSWELTTAQTGFKARGASGGYVYAVPFSGGGVSTYSMLTADSGAGVLAYGWNTLTSFPIPVADRFSVSTDDIVSMVSSSDTILSTTLKKSSLVIDSKIQVQFYFRILSGATPIATVGSVVTGVVDDTSEVIYYSVPNISMKCGADATIDTIEVIASALVPNIHSTWSFTDLSVYPFSPS